MVGMGRQLGEAPSQGGRDTTQPAVSVAARIDQGAALWAGYGRMYVPADRAGTDLPVSGAVHRVWTARVDDDAADGYALIDLYTDWDRGTMTAIMDCESSGQNIRSHQPDGHGVYSYGPFQIYGEPEVLESPAYGAERAHEKFLAAVARGGTGYEPWSCYGG